MQDKMVYQYVCLEKQIADLEAHNEVVGVSGLGRLLDLITARTRVTLGDIFADGSLEQHRFLTHVAYLQVGKSRGNLVRQRTRASLVPCPQWLRIETKSNGHAQNRKCSTEICDTCPIMNAGGTHHVVEV